MAAKNPAFREVGVCQMVACPMLACSLPSHEEPQANSAATGGFDFHSHDSQATTGGFNFLLPEGQVTADSQAGTSMLLQDESTHGVLHGGSLAADDVARKARQVEKTCREAFGAATVAMPDGIRSIVKGHWNAHEDILLLKLVEQYGTQNWSKVAKQLTGRVGAQCRVRWHNHLRPTIKKDTWTEEEERILVEMHLKIGNKWSTIAKCIPGRSENMVKNHWNSTKRSLQATRRNKKKAGPGPHPTILMDYIRSKMAFLEAGSHPPPDPSAPTPSKQMEFALGGQANLSTMPSSSDWPALAQLGNYPDITPLPMHPHLDPSYYYVPQHGLCSNTYSYPLDFGGYPDNNYLQQLGYTPDSSGIDYRQYNLYPMYCQEHDADLGKNFAHLNLGEERKLYASFGLCDEAKPALAPGYIAQADPRSIDVGDVDLVQMMSQQVSLPTGGYDVAAP